MPDRTPTGHTEPRGCPFGFRHYNCDCKPLEATTPEPADRPPLRDQIAQALYEWAVGHTTGGARFLAGGTDKPLRENSHARADAVLHAIEPAMLAIEVDATQRADELAARLQETEREIEQLRAMYVSACDRSKGFRDDLKWVRSELAKADAENRAAGQRAETAERQHAEALDQIATERRGRLAAEAAVRRVRAVCEQPGPLAVAALRADILAALDAEQPKETP